MSGGPVFKLGDFGQTTYLFSVPPSSPVSEIMEILFWDLI